MRGTRFFRIGIASAASLLVLLLAGGAGFVSVAWAGKPDHARKTHTEYGYAILRDSMTDVIRSDEGGQYVDCNIGGKDLVKIVLYDDDGTLKYVDVYFGKMTHHYYPDFGASSRRVRFEFDISNATKMQDYEGHKAVYDILVWKDANRKERRGTQVGSDYYLNDLTVHAPMKIYNYATELTDWVQFAVDRGYEGKQTDGAITQEAVDAFYPDDENIDYWDTSEYPPEPGQIIYTLDYDVNGFDIVSDDTDEDNRPDIWIFTATGSPVRLFVEKHTYPPKGKGMTWRTERVYLAEYAAAPFQLTVSLKDLSSYSPAPRKHNALSTLWGKIKAR